MSSLQIPTDEDIDHIANAFVSDLSSFTVTDEESGHILPVICCICDSIPTKAQWNTYVNIEEFIKLCHRGRLRKDNSVKSYSQELQNQYTAKDIRLKEFVLSPETYVSPRDEVLLCKECLSELRSNSEKKTQATVQPHNPSLEDTWSEMHPMSSAI
jgi:hypothetical protein